MWSLASGKGRQILDGDRRWYGDRYIGTGRFEVCRAEKHSRQGILKVTIGYLQVMAPSQGVGL